MEIVILFGGNSTEREVSLVSGHRVDDALRQSGHKVTLFDYRFGGFSKNEIETLRRADVVFLALHGGDGENGCLQAELEDLGIYHYTGSGPSASALAMDKARAKERVAVSGVPVAAGTIWQPDTPMPPLFFPVALKPVSGGSSVGLILAEDVTRLATYAPTEPMLCEAFLSGTEYTVGILEGKALPIVEIRPATGVYDYEAKYRQGGAMELCPAPLDEAQAHRLQILALAAYSALGLRDYARVDFKCDGAGNPYFLEANTLPGLTGTSLLPLAARAAGFPFPTLVGKICLMAAIRKKA